MHFVFVSKTAQSICGSRLQRGKGLAPCSYRWTPHVANRLCPSLVPRKRSQPWVGRSSPEDMYGNLFNSPVFKSEVVMKEFSNIVKDVTGLSQMASKFPEFDLTGKRMYLDKMEEVSSRYEIFIKRLELSQDPAAKEYLRFTNAQMLEGGFTLGQMFTGLKQNLDEYRRWVEQEERVSSDPIAHQQFLEYFRSTWSSSMLGRVDLSYLLRSTDPAIIFKAQNDPKFWVAIKEISASPTNEVLSKWLDDAAIGPLVAELWKGMQAKGK